MVFNQVLPVTSSLISCANRKANRPVPPRLKCFPKTSKTLLNQFENTISARNSPDHSLGLGLRVLFGISQPGWRFVHPYRRSHIGTLLIPSPRFECTL